jgi:hypothetical protein
MRVLLAAMVLALLAGCTQIQAKLDAQVQTVTLPDLTAALADATAAGNSSGVACWSGLITYVNALPTVSGTSSTPVIVGVATAIELGSEAAQSPVKLISLPPLPRPVHDACSGILQDDVNLLAKFGLTASAIVKGAPVAAAVIK